MRKLLPFKLRGRYCVFIGLVSLTLQFLLFLFLLYALEESEDPTQNSDLCSSFCKDFRSLTMVSLEIGVNLVILDREFLESHLRERKNSTRFNNCYYCPFSPVVLGLDSAAFLEKKLQVSH